MYQWNQPTVLLYQCTNEINLPSCFINVPMKSTYPLAWLSTLLIRNKEWWRKLPSIGSKCFRVIGQPRMECHGRFISTLQLKIFKFLIRLPHNRVPSCQMTVCQHDNLSSNLCTIQMSDIATWLLHKMWPTPASFSFVFVFSHKKWFWCLQGSNSDTCTRTHVR